MEFRILMISIMRCKIGRKRPSALANPKFRRRLRRATLNYSVKTSGPNVAKQEGFLRKGGGGLLTRNYTDFYTLFHHFITIQYLEDIDHHPNSNEHVNNRGHFRILTWKFCLTYLWKQQCVEALYAYTIKANCWKPYWVFRLQVNPMYDIEHSIVHSFPT